MRRSPRRQNGFGAQSQTSHEKPHPDHMNPQAVSKYAFRGGPGRTLHHVFFRRLRRQRQTRQPVR